MTRSAVTRPLVALRVLFEDQAVRAAADEMITLTYAMRDACATSEALTAAREAAQVAHDRFVDAAAGYLARTACPRPTRVPPGRPRRNVIALRRPRSPQPSLAPAHQIGVPMEQQAKALARISGVETSTERTAGTTVGEDLAVLAPAAAAALSLLADAVRRGGADHDHIVQALKAAGVHEAFASVFDAASERVMEAADDPFDFDERLHANNLAGAAGDVRRAFTWL
ncbi:hypothetical protein ACFRFL_45785 [Streptomyces sp. NPDC056708]|uniref:hypothetical protein n=1 Tax=unclassified Streptomyces TaxID=2593676 RepID=UPI0036A6B90C